MLAQYGEAIIFIYLSTMQHRLTCCTHAPQEVDRCQGRRKVLLSIALLSKGGNTWRELLTGKKPNKVAVFVFTFDVCIPDSSCPVNTLFGLDRRHDSCDTFRALDVVNTLSVLKQTACYCGHPLITSIDITFTFKENIFVRHFRYFFALCK